MKIRKVRKDALDLFVAVLPSFGEVYAPVRRGTGWAFAPPRRWSEVDLHYTRTLLPPKKILLPPNERMLRFRQGEGYQDLLLEAAKPIVLFGVHAYDIVGIAILDRVFGGGRYPDPYYATRRRNTTIVGIDFTPDARHFCPSMNADWTESGFDLFLSDIGDHYMVLVGTSRGDDIVEHSGCLLEEPTAADFAEYKHRSAKRRQAYATEVEIGDLPGILEMEYGSKVWDELGARCLACGACTAVCPTCYCFDVYDEDDLAAPTGTRGRTWDSCLFASHAMVAGGENFRARRAARVKFRFYHKQRGFVAEYGRPSCVGCGRCSAVCPVGIDIVQVIRAVRDEDQHATVGQPEPRVR
jgi:sulfhydrogenase subunit beta (sulfur reductase)